MTTTVIEATAFFAGLSAICDREVADTEDTIQRQFMVMDSYWTPAEGHKYSKECTVAKWRDLLWIASMAHTSSMAEKSRTLWYAQYCALYSNLRDFGVDPSDDPRLTAPITS